MKPANYIEDRLRLLRKSGTKYLCGGFRWATAETEVPTGKLLLVADHGLGSWTPSIAVIQDNTEHGLHLLQALEPFSGSYVNWEVWAPLPDFPGSRSVTLGSPWIDVKDRTPKHDGTFLVLTPNQDAFVAMRSVKAYGETFVYLLSTRISGELAFADIPVEALYWAELPPYPDPEDEE